MLAMPEEPRPISNSFDYVPARALPRFELSADRCSARRLGLAQAASSRGVIIRSGSRFHLCQTSTADFPDSEIREVVHACGQLYLDVSRELAIHDFARHVRQLVLSSECRRCPDLPTCVGCYEPAPRSYFLDDEAWLRDELGRLEGVVLDVGLGQVPYLDAAAPAIRAGRLAYHGVDPDPGAAEEARRTGLPLTVHPVAIEDFAPPPGVRFDHALSIRSLGHFRDVRRAFENLAACVRPGGTLLVIESLPLPLVRDTRHAAAAHHAAQGGFQHFRNWSSQRLLEEIAHMPWILEHHRPVGRETTDQWIVKLRRA